LGLPRCGVLGPITSNHSEIVRVLARQTRFLELESAKLVVSSNLGSRRILAASKSIPARSRTAGRICIVLTSLILNLLPQHLLAAAFSQERTSSNAGMRLCKLRVAWQNSHAQKHRELAQCVKNVSPIHRAKLRSLAISVFSPESQLNQGRPRR